MALMVYNTLARQYEQFVPVEEGKVSIYVCGITPYDHSHIGHARPAVFWDVVRRYLLHKGYKVKLVTNFTDIDDKLINRSRQTRTPIPEIAEKFIQEYLECMDKLGVLRADVYPRASEVIPEIIETVETLIDKGLAYESAGDVYFRAERFPGYGKLSGKKIEDLLPGARVEVSELKESPLDWALWKASAPDEPGWPSPWGKGRPGWHIECSVMVHKHLGPQIDMHGGGTELVFPHHENEVAQAETVSGVEPYVRYWVHSELLNLEGEKMSKSLGNVIYLSDIVNNHDPMAVRLYLLSAHRRKILDFSDELLRSAEKGWERIRTGYQNAVEFLANPSAQGLRDASKLAEATAQCRKAFFESMDNDFATPGALAAVFDLITAINAHVVPRGETTADPDARQKVAGAYGLLIECLGILGLVPQAELTPVSRGRDISNGLIDILVEIRNTARKQKDYTTADYIRDKMGDLGITLEDTPSGTKVRM